MVHFLTYLLYFISFCAAQAARTMTHLPGFVELQQLCGWPWTFCRVRQSGHLTPPAGTAPSRACPIPVALAPPVGPAALASQAHLPVWIAVTGAHPPGAPGTRSLGSSVHLHSWTRTGDSAESRFPSPPLSLWAWAPLWRVRVSSVSLAGGFQGSPVHPWGWTPAYLPNSPGLPQGWEMPPFVLECSPLQLSQFFHLSLPGILLLCLQLSFCALSSLPNGLYFQWMQFLLSSLGSPSGVSGSKCSFGPEVPLTSVAQPCPTR